MINHVHPNPHGFLILYVISCDIRPIGEPFMAAFMKWPWNLKIGPCKHARIKTFLQSIPSPLAGGSTWVKRGCQVGREPKWLKLHQSPNFRAPKLPSTSVSMDLARDPGAPSWSHCRIPRYHITVCVNICACITKINYIIHYISLYYIIYLVTLYHILYIYIINNVQICPTYNHYISSYII